MDQEEVARVVGVPMAQVRIIPTACGGGFGGKLDVSIQPLIAVAAWLTRKPVRIVYSRTESMASTTKRHPSKIQARMSADASGRFTAYEMQGDFNTGAYASWGPTVANRVPVHATGPYKVPHVRNATRAVHTNEVPAGAFRGFGVPQAAIAGETLIDDLAERLGLDRWQIRRINAIGHGDRTPTGQVLHASAGLPECLDAVKAEYDELMAAAAAHNARAAAWPAASASPACGTAAATPPCPTRRRCGSRSPRRAADLPQRRGGYRPGLVHRAPADRGRCAGPAAAGLRLRHRRYRQDLRCRQDLGLAPDVCFGECLAACRCGPPGEDPGAGQCRPTARLALDGSRLTVEDGEASRVIDLATLAADEAGIVLMGDGEYDPPTTALDAKGQGIPYATYGFAAQVAEVEVDRLLGTVKVTRIVAAHDVGRAINPTLTEGQIHGGIAQGLGLALMEEYLPGRTENLHDYLIPTAGDVPEIRIHLIEDPEPEGPFGAKGVGEPALVATAPAILGAIRHAVGVRMTEVPVLPHKLWAAMQGQREAAE